MVTDRLAAKSSKTMYNRALLDFFAWFAATPANTRFNKRTVLRYRNYLLNERKPTLAPASVNQRLSAIRGLATEARDDGLINGRVADGVAKVKGIRTSGARMGTWLTKEKAQDLLDAPDLTTLKGMRDQAVLAVLLGCGLRRAEAAALQFDDIQQRDGRWVIVDIVGKGRRVRSVPVPAWAKAAVDVWSAASGVSTGRIFRSLRKGSRLNGSSLSDQALADIVEAYSRPLKLGVAPHDLRRTFAKLALKGQSRLEQISLTLGHQSIQTTQRYLGVELDLQDAPCDRLGLRLRSA